MSRSAEHGDEGSMALELTVLGPVLLALIALALVYSRHEQVTGQLESGARDAARAVSQSRTGAEAQQRADDIARTALLGTPSSCAASAGDAHPAQISGAFVAGGTITVTIECHVSYSDLGLPGVSNTVDLSRTFTSSIDLYAGVRP